MKKILLVLAVLAVVVFAVRSSEASDLTYFPNGNIAVYLNEYDLGMGGVHAVVNFNNDGTATGSILDYEGYVVTDLYMSPAGYLYYSDDGLNFYPL